MRVKGDFLSNYGSGVTFGKGKATKDPDGNAITDYVTYTGPTDFLVFNSRGLSNAGWVFLTNDHGDVYAGGTLTSGVIKLRKYDGGSWK